MSGFHSMGKNLCDECRYCNYHCHVVCDGCDLCLLWLSLLEILPWSEKESDYPETVEVGGLFVSLLVGCLLA